jgi:glycosyltransferase involved in cell wall biosynthesis
MKSKGWDVHVAVPDSEVVAIARSWDCEVHPLRVKRGSMNPFRESKSLAAWKALRRALEPDLSHHFTSKAVLYGGMAGGRCVVSTITGVGMSLGAVGAGPKAWAVRKVAERMYRRALGNTTRVIFQNEDDLRTMLERGLVDKAKTVLIRGSGIDMDLCHPSKRVARPGRPIRFVMLSRLITLKGVREYVAAAREVHRRLPEQCEFLLAGNLDLENPEGIPEAEVHSWEADGAVRWVGVVPNAVEAYKEADVAVLPSYWNEGLPRTVVEGAAMGLAVITTDHIGCRDTLIPDVTGIMVQPRDVEGLTCAILALATDAAKREAMGLAGRDFVAGRYSVESVLEQTFKVYDEALRLTGGQGLDA